MNLQANFKQLEVGGRYTNGVHRTVDIISVERVTDPNDLTNLVNRWTGQLYKPNGQPDTVQFFQDNGTLWNARGVSTPNDLARHDGRAPAPVAA